MHRTSKSASHIHSLCRSLSLTQSVLTCQALSLLLAAASRCFLSSSVSLSISAMPWLPEGTTSSKLLGYPTQCTTTLVSSGTPMGPGLTTLILPWALAVSRVTLPAAWDPGGARFTTMWVTPGKAALGTMRPPRRVTTFFSSRASCSATSGEMKTFFFFCSAFAVSFSLN